MGRTFVPKGTVYRIMNDVNLLGEAMFQINQNIKRCVSESVRSVAAVEHVLQQRVPEAYQAYKLITRRDNGHNFDLARHVAFDGVWLQGGKFYSYL